MSKTREPGARAWPPPAPYGRSDGDALVRGRPGRIGAAEHAHFLRDAIADTRLECEYEGARGMRAAIWRQGDVDFTVPAMDFHLLVLCLAGQHVGSNDSEALGGRRDAAYGPTDFFFAPAGYPVKASFKGAVTHLHVMIEQDLMRRAVSEARRGDPDRIDLRGFNIRRDKRLLALAGEVQRQLRDPLPAGGLLLEGLGLALAAAIAGDQAAGAPAAAPKRRAAPLEGARLARVIDRIESDLAHTPSLADLAADCGLSAFHFSRAFQAATGSPPHRFILERRISRALILLAETDAPISSIAYDCGFCSQAHMTSVFTRRLGATPGAVRAAARGRTGRAPPLA